MCAWGSHMCPHTYPGQWCLRRLPEEDLCRAGTHSVPHRRVTHWTETPAVRCQRNSPAGTGCPWELWGYMWDRDSEDTEYRDTNTGHGVRKKGDGWGKWWRVVRTRERTEKDKGDSIGENETEERMWWAECCSFVGFLLNWVKEKWVSKWFIQVDL